ncbi:MAG: hypothetical protein K2G04_10780, partial [Oscillospiraceae bacterium]|nr:hypothetical protein [Oscillospiraceae bacterium]
MIEIKTKTAAFLFIIILTLSAFLCACSSGRNDTLPHEKISFSDRNGISFSLQVTPCSDGGNGKINLDIDGESTYLYSTDFGRSFRRAKSSGTSLNRLDEDSYSFCFMERDMPDTVTDIYTVYADNLLRPYPITVTAVSEAENILSDGAITVRIENFADGTEYEATIDGWETIKDFFGETVSFPSLGGLYELTVREKNAPDNVSPTLKVPVVHADIGTSAYIEVTAVMQTPELPTGCEVTA